ncbi:hypothetical protein BH09ACT2_BH09ACT2_21650 [soil metagenome]
MTEPTDGTPPTNEARPNDARPNEPLETRAYVTEVEDVAEPVAKAPRTARGALLVGARVLTGVIGIAVAAVAIGAAVLVPLPSHTAPPVSRLVTPVASAQQRICAGPLLRLGDDTGQAATSVSSVGRPAVRYGQTVGKATLEPLASTDSTTGVAPDLLTLPPRANTSAAPLLSGSQVQAVSSGDLVGLAAAECAEGSSDSWLVGGATDTGRTTLITLSNPSNVVATVNLSIFSETGPIVAAGTDGIVVPPGGQRVLSLAGFAPNITSPVVRVQSRGGQVVADLQQSIVRTLEPGGVDIVGTSAAPSTLTVIPGLVLSNGTAVAARQAESGFGDLSAIIRLYVPGADSAKAEITIVPENGSEPAIPVRMVVQPGIVTEVPLDSYPDGSYTVTIASDKPLVAGARTSTVGTAGQSDFAWSTSTTSVVSRALVTIAPGPTPLLHLANPTQKDATVTLSHAADADVSVRVPAGRTVSQPVIGGANYTLTGFDKLAISVSYLGDGQLATFSVSPSAPASRPIVIYP